MRRALITAALLVNLAACSPPRALERPRPKYPDIMRSAQISGTVIASLSVDRQGAVSSIRFDSTPRVHPLLQVAARNTLQATRFRPAMRFGRARASEVSYSIQFFLGPPTVIGPDEQVLPGPERIPGCPAELDETHLVVCSVPVIWRGEDTF